MLCSAFIYQVSVPRMIYITYTMTAWVLLIYTPLALGPAALVLQVKIPHSCGNGGITINYITYVCVVVEEVGEVRGGCGSKESGGTAPKTLQPF